MFVIDSGKEQIAVREARALDIPVVAVVDTNCNPEDVDQVVPGNDDALRAIRLFTSKIADAVLEGRAVCEQARLEAAKAQEAAEAAAAAAEAGAEAAQYEGTPEELEEVAEVYDPDELLPPHLRPRAVPETQEGEGAEDTGETQETQEAQEAKKSSEEGGEERPPEGWSGSTNS